MDRTLATVRKMLQALGAPAYDLGILSERGMLPGLCSLSASRVISRLALLKAHNARGAHIYVRPSGEHRFTVLDDLNRDSIDRLASDGLAPCAVVETSTGNFQAWLKHDDLYPAHLSTFVARKLAERYGADQAPRIGDDSVGSPASPTPSRSTAKPMASSHSCCSEAQPASNAAWHRTCGWR